MVRQRYNHKTRKNEEVAAAEGSLLLLL